MLRLALLLGAAGYVYSLGHNSAAPAAGGPAKPSMVSNIASVGATWIAREVHEQTAWAARDSAAADAAPASAPERAPEPPALQPAAAGAFAAEFARPAPVVVTAPSAPRRTLQVIIDPPGKG